MTPLEAWLQWRNFAWRPDLDGQPWHCTDHDSGAGTAWGVIQVTWNDAVGKGIVKGDLRSASQDACGTVLYVSFWKECRCDAMHPAVGGIVFDMAMADGVGGAGRIIERRVGAPVDQGIIGPITLAAINKLDPAAVVDMLTKAEEAFTDSLADAVWFGNGWRRRAVDAEAFARTMLPAPASASA